MKKSLLLISAAALGSLALLSGCSDDSKSDAPAKSAEQPSADAPANPADAPAAATASDAPVDAEAASDAPEEASDEPESDAPENDEADDDDEADDETETGDDDEADDDDDGDDDDEADSPEQKAVNTYRLRFIRAMLQKEPAAMDRSSSEESMTRLLQTMQYAYDKTPTDGLPEEHAAFVRDYRAQFGVLLKMLAAADTSTEEGQAALAAANEKAEQTMQKLEEKYPNAYSSLAHATMLEFFGETLSKLGYEDKANELIEQKPDLEEDLPQLMKEVAKRLIQEIDEELAE